MFKPKQIRKKWEKAPLFFERTEPKVKYETGSGIITLPEKYEISGLINYSDWVGYEPQKIYEPPKIVEEPKKKYNYSIEDWGDW